LIKKISKKVIIMLTIILNRGNDSNVGKKVLPDYFANYGATFQGGNVYDTPKPL
jgi:hypothetical protein